MSNIVDLFWDRVDRSPDRPALRQRVGPEWEAVSWRKYGRAVTEVAAGMVALGVEPGDRVAIPGSARDALGRRWLAPNTDAHLTHTPFGGALVVELACASCGETVSLDDITFASHRESDASSTSA